MSVIDVSVNPQSAEPGYCVYIRITVLTLQSFTHHHLWKIHKEIMHTGTVHVQFGVGASVCNVCTDCLTGPQCIHSTKVTWTSFFALAPVFLFCCYLLSLSLLSIHYSKLQMGECWKAGSTVQQCPETVRNTNTILLTHSSHMDYISSFMPTALLDYTVALHWCWKSSLFFYSGVHQFPPFQF